MSEQKQQSILAGLSELLLEHAKECPVSRRGGNCHVEQLLLSTCLVIEKQSTFIEDMLVLIERLIIGELTTTQFISQVSLFTERQVKEWEAMSNA